MNKEQFKRIRNLVNKLKSQATSEGLTSVEFELLLSKFLTSQGYTVKEYLDAEKKYKNLVEEDTSDIPAMFFGEKGDKGDRGNSIVGPQGPMGPQSFVPGPMGPRGPQGPAGTITTEDFRRLREKLYEDQVKPADLDRKLNERFDGINKKLNTFVTTSVLEPSVKEIVTPELNRILRSFQSSIYAAMQDAKKALNAASGGTVTSVSVVTANGVSGSVATATTTPAITLTLGDITPSSVNVSGLTASELVITDASKNLASAAIATYPSLTELTYVKGVTSAIQTQFTGKAATDQTMYIGTTAVAINRASAALTLAGITLTTPDIGTPSAGTLTNCTGLPVAGIAASTVTALGVGSIELGHATDTTIARVSAGVVSIEGKNIYLAGGTDVAVTDGGTGVSAITALSIWVANSANTIAEVTPGAGNSIRVNAGGTAWEAYTPGGGGDLVITAWAGGDFNGTAALGNIAATFSQDDQGGIAPVLEFGDAATTDAIGTVKVPSGATSISNIRIIYSREVATDVVIELTTQINHMDTDAQGAGTQDTDSARSYQTGTGTIGHSAFITLNAAAYNGITVDANDMVGFLIRRNGAAAPDTYGTEWQVFGVEFTFA